MIGILTMPTEDNQKSESFQYDHYTWEHNINFVHYAGSYSAVVKYDIEDEELYPLLDGLNGIMLTGGPVEQADPVTKEPHVYVKTVEKIVNYAKREFDEGRYFPILAFC